MRRFGGRHQPNHSGVTYQPIKRPESAIPPVARRDSAYQEVDKQEDVLSRGCGFGEDALRQVLNESDTHDHQKRHY